MNKKQIIISILAVILLIFAAIDLRNYEKNNYDVAGFNFVCNQDVCEIRHKKRNGQIKYVDKINISEIDHFSAKLEEVPRTNGEGYVIYANCKDGTEFKISPIYVSVSSKRYLKDELLIPLNTAIKNEPISINVSFPY